MTKNNKYKAMSREKYFLSIDLKKLSMETYPLTKKEHLTWLLVKRILLKYKIFPNQSIKTNHQLTKGTEINLFQISSDDKT